MDTNEEKNALNKAIFDYQREMFEKGRFYQSEMAQYLIQLSFERGVQWKDEQFCAEKQALIDKVCEVLKIRLLGDCMSKESLDYFIIKFRKTMEETR